MTQDTIRALPTLNPNITDLAPLLPGVQASDDAALSTKGGELLPALISISGGKADQNSFLVDGVSGVNLLDPLASNPEDPQNIPAHPLGLFPNAHLVEEVTILDHNIPARYGNFTGGVIDVRTRKPGRTFGAGVNMRSTRSNWTWFQVPEEEEEDFRNSATYKEQPEFDKYDAGFDFDLPAGSDAGLLGAYQRTWSDLSLNYLGGRKPQRRLLENYLLKWGQEIGPRDSLELSLLATPYQGDYFLKDTKDSDYAIRSRGLGAEALWTTARDNVKLEFSAAFTRNELTRNAPQDYWLWLKTASRNWGPGTYSSEGGFGSLERQQESVQLQTHLSTSSSASGWLRQAVTAGLQLGWTNGRSVRRDTTRSYSGATATGAPADCGGDPACVAGEQYFKTVKIYDPYSVEADRSELGAYLEDLFVLGPLSLRPGLRFDYDTFSQNQNLAPRSTLAYNLFGTKLLFGANRYYGVLTFTDVLREGEKWPRTLSRTSFAGVWTERLPTTSTSRADLKTPYTDEVSAGIAQPLPGGNLSLDYVHRKGKDEIARQSDQLKVGSTTYNIRSFNNNGRSRYESYRLAWDGRWRKTGVLANVTYEKESKTSVENYDDFLTEATLDRLVYYNGQFLYRDELPRLDYHRTWVGNLILTQRLPLGFEFTNVSRYRGAYHALQVEKTNQVIDGQTVDVYAEVKSPAGWTFDWKLAWRQPVGPGEVLLSVEVLNVFNHSNRVGGEEGLYEAGRQVWAGVEGRY